MSDEGEKVVYLEDLEAKTTTSIAVTSTSQEKSASVDVVATSSNSSATAKAGSSTAPLKRQRTLMEMMSASASGNSAKKVKLSPNKGAPSSSPSQKLNNENAPATATSSGLQSLNSIPFSLSELKDSLSEEQRQLLELECETMGKSWLKVLKDEIKKPYFISLKKFLWQEGVRGPDDQSAAGKIYPAPRNIYAWSNTPLGRVRVVIIGQDPYHNPGQAHGLCFSVPPGIAIPPSLRNIYAEIRAEYPHFVPPKHGNLSAWAQNGVLLLNTALTVRANTAGSHSNKGWEQFTDKVVDVVDKYGGSALPAEGGSKPGYGRGIVFLAWGAWAAKRVAKLDKKKHLILTSAHPSPLSASRGFMGNGHFKKANDWLERRYGKDGLVDWCKLDAE